MKQDQQALRPSDVKNPEDALRALLKLAEAIRDLQKKEIAKGFLVSEIPLSPYGVPFVIRHDLGRPANYLMTRSNAPVVIYDIPSPDQTTELRLLASAPATVNLWIF